MNKIVVPLSRMVLVHGEEKNEIELHEPTAGDLRSLPIGEKLTIDTLLNIAASASGWPPSSIDKLAAADTFKIVEALGSFLEPSTLKAPPS
ncbi:MAG: phage tail assembly protein [Candidatus Accumulibacter sp.]|nr:phage tail assembly protein [Accumulibacter sp.]